MLTFNNRVYNYVIKYYHGTCQYVLYVYYFDLYMTFLFEFALWDNGTYLLYLIGFS